MSSSHPFTDFRLLNWIDDKENKTVIGLQRTLGMYIDTFAFSSPLERRNENDAFRHIAGEWVYPKIKEMDTIPSF